jgi:aryl-alcohol dehydrogenase-like predicted oxidoreductase
LAYGCWRLTDPARARPVIETAVEAGMTLIDTADVYGLDFGGAGFGAAEELLGRVLAEAPDLRDRIVLATKGGISPGVPYDSSAAGLRAACEASLRRLQVDVIDLYQVHRVDVYTHPAEVAATLAALRDEGKVREVGVSNTMPWQLQALQAHLPFPLATAQPELGCLDLRPITGGLLDVCMQAGVTPLAYSPLGGGRLLGDDLPAGLAVLLDGLAEREGVDRAAVALAWVLAHASRPVAIVGTTSPERIRAATAALRVHLDRTDAYAVLEAAQGHPHP